MKKIAIVGIVMTLMLALNTMAASVLWRAGVITGTPVNSGSNFTADWTGQSMMYYTVASSFDLVGYTADLAAGNDLSGYALTAAGSGAITGSTKGESVVFSPNAYAALETIYGFGMAMNANGNMVAAGTVDYMINDTLWSGTIGAPGADRSALSNTWATVDVVPEPTSMALLALGLAVFGLRRKLS